MQRRGGRIDEGATTLQSTSEIAPGDAKMTPKKSVVREYVKTDATVSPTEREVAVLAYQLWLNAGCPEGGDQEDWFRAEAMLKNAFLAECEDSPRLLSSPQCGTPTESEVRCEFRWSGHWEVWESEWCEAHWIWD